MIKLKALGVWLTIILFMTSMIVVAQSTVSITKADGSVQNVLVTETGKLYFLESELFINDGSNNIVDFPFSDIRKLQITSGEISTILGDVNNDGSVNVGDVMTMIAYIFNENPDVFIFDNADINGDGVINIIDIEGVINIIYQ